MKRRSWWTIVDKLDECHFAWTQIKIPDIFRCQKKCQSLQQPIETPQISIQKKLSEKEIDNN
jgi:hypothetical protein